MNVLCALNNQALSKQDNVSTNLSPSSHEEADTRVQDAASKGFSKVKLLTVDTDVVAIGWALYDEIDGLQELWIDFGIDKSRRYYPINEIVIELWGKWKELIFPRIYWMWPGILFCKVWQNYS